MRFAPDKKISGSSQNRACIAHGACIPESREKALSHMAFATLPSFCKRECKTRAMSESRLVMRKKPDFTMVFVIGPRVRRVAGGARFGLVPLCPGCCGTVAFLVLVASTQANKKSSLGAHAPRATYPSHVKVRSCARWDRGGVRPPLRFDREIQRD